LPVYEPSEAEKSNPVLFACNVRERIAEYLNVPTTSHTYEDCLLMLNAREKKLPFESGLIEFDKLRQKLVG
jgi:lysophosphatidylcholine acyltransferase/lyso-PAF acetyltransferase